MKHSSFPQVHSFSSLCIFSSPPFSPSSSRRLVCRFRVRFRPRAFERKKSSSFTLVFFLIEQRRNNFLKTVCKGEQHLSRHLLHAAPFERPAELHPACAARFLCDVKLSAAVGCNRKRSAGSCEVNCVRLAVWPVKTGRRWSFGCLSEKSQGRTLLLLLLRLLLLLPSSIAAAPVFFFLLAG